jgi:putative serine protease PepD
MNFTGVGALIAKTSSGIMSGGPAQKAGLKPGDIIVKFQDRGINAAEELIVAVRSKNVGDRITISYVREGKEYSATLSLIAAKD